MDLHRVLEGKFLASFPVLKCLTQESLFHGWTLPSPSTMVGSSPLPSCSTHCRREGNNLFYDETATSQEHHIHAKNSSEGTQNWCSTMNVPHLLLSLHPIAFTQTLLRKTYSHSVDCCKKIVGVHLILSAFPCGKLRRIVWIISTKYSSVFLCVKEEKELFALHPFI